MSGQIGYPDFFSIRVTEYGGVVKRKYQNAVVNDGNYDQFNLISSTTGQVIAGLIELDFVGDLSLLNITAALDTVDFPILNIIGSNLAELVIQPTNYAQIAKINRSTNQISIIIPPMPVFSDQFDIFVGNNTGSNVDVSITINYYDYTQ